MGFIIQQFLDICNRSISWHLYQFNSKLTVAGGTPALGSGYYGYANDEIYRYATQAMGYSYFDL